MEQAMSSVLQALWTAGHLVHTPNGQTGVVYAFNRTTNEVTVRVAPLPANEVPGVRMRPTLEEQLRAAHGLRDYHFTKLRSAEQWP